VPYFSLVYLSLEIGPKLICAFGLYGLAVDSDGLLVRTFLRKQFKSEFISLFGMNLLETWRLIADDFLLSRNYSLFAIYEIKSKTGGLQSFSS